MEIQLVQAGFAKAVMDMRASKSTLFIRSRPLQDLRSDAVPYLVLNYKYVPSTMDNRQFTQGCVT